MAQTRARVVYSCGACGQQAPRWVGRCAACGEWGTVAEEAPPAGPRRGVLAPVPEVTRLADLAEGPLERMETGIAELDRVLGGGLVPGSLVLIGGEPGIGKSTLVLQALASLAGAEASGGGRVMLVTGEESPLQVRGRAERLDCDCGQVQVLAETRLEVGARGHRGAPAGPVRGQLGADAPFGRPRRRAGRAQPGPPSPRWSSCARPRSAASRSCWSAR